MVSWDAVSGADYYNIYHDDFWSSGCRLNSSGSTGFCDELAPNVTGTTYTHANPDDDNNYYWVVACNAGGCSEIGGDPAEFIDTRPAAPRNVSAVRDGSSATLSWSAVSGADYYNIYHDDFWSSGCSLNSSGSTSFCDELAANVTGTTYTHANPDDDNNYYWVVACNRGGCSDIDGNNPTELGAGGGNTGGGGTDPGADSYTPLEGLRVTASGGVSYIFLSAGGGGCLEINNISFNGVVYTVHTSKWQRRADAGSPWSDVSGTERQQGALCGYNPTASGEYRLVADMTIGGRRGNYSSENSIVID